MKNKVYVVDDWFDYQTSGLEHDADAFPVAVCADEPIKVFKMVLNK